MEHRLIAFLPKSRQERSYTKLILPKISKGSCRDRKPQFMSLEVKESSAYKKYEEELEVGYTLVQHRVKLWSLVQLRTKPTQYRPRSMKLFQFVLLYKRSAQY